MEMKGISLMARWAWYIGCWCAFFGLSLPLGAQESDTLRLADLFQKAERGDYVVSEQGKVYTLLHIFGKEGSCLVLEEISAPAPRKNGLFDWKSWVAEGAPGHTSWTLYKLDLSSGTTEEAYSFTRQMWLSLNKEESLLATLSRIELSPVAEGSRRRVGPRPRGGNLDRRPLWNPPIIAEGLKVENAFCEAWKGYWPMDGGDLSGKAILVFLARQPGPHLCYFPYWIEIHGGMKKVKLRLVDSGHGLISPTTGFPPL